MSQPEARIREMEQRFNGMIEEIDKAYLRKMQGDMHRCAANCCDNQSLSLTRTQNCVENCSKTLENAQQFVESEVSRLQNRWSRCFMECNDQAKDNMGAGKSKDKLELDHKNCTSKCIDMQIDLMHTAATNIKRALASRNENERI